MFNIMLRVLILYLCLLIVMRVMGKRQIGQLQPYELVLTLIIANLSTAPMENTGVPLLNGIIPILVLVFCQVLLTVLNLKWPWFRRLLCGRPRILIAKGRIQEEELSRLRFTLTDLTEQLRIKDIPDIAEVEYAIVEPNGMLSVFPKAHLRPLTPEDMELHPGYEGVSTTLILDGQPNYDTLETLNKDLEWLGEQARHYGCSGIKDVLFASIDGRGRIFLQARLPETWYHNPEDIYTRKGGEKS